MTETHVVALHDIKALEALDRVGSNRGGGLDLNGVQERPSWITRSISRFFESR